jgi:nicotinamidase-related amidase
VPFKNLTGPVPAVSLNDGRAALVVLDIHRFTALRDAGFGRIASERGILRELEEYYAQIDQVLPNIALLVDACRGWHLPVVFTRLVAGSAADVTPLAAVTGFWTRPESAEADYLSALRPGPDDLSIDRSGVSVFRDTVLQDALDRRNIHSLIICGLLATGAVDLAAREAADRGYGVIVVSDACAADTWAAHTFLMTMLVGGLTRTRTAQAVTEMLGGMRT